MANEPKFLPQNILRQDIVSASGSALIFGYELRVVKRDGAKVNVQDEGWNPKRWDVGTTNGFITELWLPPATDPALSKKK